MIDWDYELKIFWNKYKNAFTYEEWQALVKDVAKFDNPVVLPRIVKCLEIIEERYKQIKNNNKSVL